jgi:uncharacterized protein YbjT (DUF2867 family)
MIVITAPTSNTGRQVVANVLARGEPVRVIVRDPSRLSPQVREQVEIVEGSHSDAEIVGKAFAGADIVFWLVAADPQAESVEAAFLDFSRPACDAFVRQGVERVVGISALGRGTAAAGRAGLVTGSLKMDDMIASTGVNYRALSLPSFMDNILRQSELIRTRGVFSSPIDADLKLPTCASCDIAAAASGLLVDRSWLGTGALPVLGPEDLSSNDMAEIMSDVLGKPVRFEQVSLEAYKARFIGYGATEAYAQAMVDMAAAKNDGLDSGAVRTPQSTSPTSFRKWCEANLRPAMLA